MKKEFVSYLQKHFPFEKLLGPAKEETKAVSFNKFRLSPGKRIGLMALKLSPWLCLLGFFISMLPIFFPEWLFVQPLTYTIEIFPGVFSFFDGQIEIQEVLKTICVGGLIGFSTNWLAIKMLFKPVEKRPIWGQGLIPAQREQIIFTLAKGIHIHILNQELIRKRIEDSGVIKKTSDLMIDGASAMLTDKELKGRLKALIRKSLSEYFEKEEVKVSIREVVDAKLEENLDKGLKGFVLRTYRRLNESEYEELIYNAISDIPRTVIDVIDRFDNEIDQAVAFLQSNKPKTEEFMMTSIVDLLYKIDIAALLRKQMEHFDEAKLEKMVREATNEQLLYIQYLGTILGVFGGLLIWEPAAMATLYVILFGILYLIDIGLYKIQSS